ncbi:MAG: diguanylate cyclase [Lachnospiraceae bacterium]|nr:diguanylate cyclase [Lachnospiraceae bacterium]
MTYASTAVLALLVHLIIHFDAIRNDHYRNETAPGKAYRALVCTVMLFYVSDALWGVLYDARLVPAVYADTVLYFAAMAASLFFWGRFVILFLHEKSRFMRFLSAVSYLAPAFFGLALVVNFFLPVMFWFDGDGVYRAGFLRYAALLVQVLMFIAVSAYLFVTLHRTEGRGKSRHAAIGIVGAVMAAMVVLQAFFPMQPLYAVACLLGTCILHTFVISDMKEDRRVELEELFRIQDEQERELGSAKHLAYTDSLTGVKSSHAYVEREKEVDRSIADDRIREFGVVVFDINNLKITNDTQGHDAGDLLIRNACRMICRQFKHSPVFRIGGDEFVAFLEGEDYRNRKALLADFEDKVESNLRLGEVTVASGMAVFRHGHDNSFRRVFERADQRMYDRKGLLKSME